MPQMAPYNWLMLNFLFSMIFIMLISMMYFIYTPILKLSLKNKMINKFNLNW